MGSSELKHFVEITNLDQATNFEVFAPELGKYFDVYAFRALLKREEKYRNIVETSNECIIITDKEAKITFANKRLEEVFGYSC